VCPPPPRSVWVLWGGRHVQFRCQKIAVQSTRMRTILPPNSNWKRMLPYSTDLRWRIVWLSLAYHATPDDIARKLQVSSRTVRRYLLLFRRGGDILPKARRNGRHCLISANHELLILRIILETPVSYIFGAPQKKGPPGPIFI
jgi:transposase-like protein